MGDFYSKFALWHSKQTNDRGIQVENFIIYNGLILVNKGGEPYTIPSPSGENNIHLTLVDGPIIFQITKWEVIVKRYYKNHRCKLWVNQA